jgi:CBS-domain-containing membrane protein
MEPISLYRRCFMTTATKSPLDLTAADVMSRDVLVIPRHMSLRAAAHLLSKARVSGAPVTDELGRCVGILSRTDLIRWMDRGEGTAPHFEAAAACICSDWQMLALDDVPEDEVRQYMTTDLVAGTPDARLGQLARWMINAHIHRVVILDRQQRPVGIVTSSDILAAVAQGEGDGDFIE